MDRLAGRAAPAGGADRGRVKALALVAILAAGSAMADDRRSGFADMSAETQEMQADDMANPGMLAVLEGRRLWDEPGAAGPSCAECHMAPEGMAGVAARYPAWDAAEARAVDLGGRIDLCRTRYQGAEAAGPEDARLLALSALVGLQSRGMPVAPDPDPPMDAVREKGEALWHTRMGQLNLSCAQCHDDNAGGRLLAAPIPQAHPVGYPIYRLEWQAMGSLQRRFRGCMTGVRSEPFPPGSAEFVALEAFLMARAGGMAVETPAVRP